MLRVDKALTIGVLSPLLAGSYFGGILKGVARAAAGAGGQVVATQTFDTGADEVVYLRPSTYRYPIGWERIDGFVVILNAADRDYVADLYKTGKPVVLISQVYPGLDCPVVAPDNRSGIQTAVAHLVGHGHRRIAFAGHVAQDDIRERYEAYRDALIAHDIEPDPRLLFDSGDAIESGGNRAAAAMIDAGLPSTAVVCGTDFNAIGLMRALLRAGLRLPADQAVVGFDGVNAARYVAPTLTTAQSRFDLVGEAAGELIARHVAGEPVAAEYHRVPATFVIRESCGCPPETSLDTWRTKIETLHQETTSLAGTLRTQYEISMDLLRSHVQDPRALQWLRRSPASSGCLGLWTDDPAQHRDPQLEIVGTFSRDPAQPPIAATTYPASSFPPAELVAAAGRATDEIVHVVPVRMHPRDWGVLSFVGPVDTQRSTSLETMNQWAALLSVALDHEAVMESLRAQEEQLRRAALYDALTDLPNRSLFLERIRQALRRSQRRPGHQFAVLFIDLDGFKLVNDSLGHLAGDRLLSQVAERISATLREGDTAARFGGDEFAILIDGIADTPTLIAIARRLQDVIAQPVASVGQDVVVTASIGIAPSTRRYNSAEDVLRDADIAMYRAKSTDKGGHAIFDTSMHTLAVSRLRTEAQLRRAVDHGELEVHYQPIVELASTRTAAFEALLRWNHPTRGLLPPAEFVPVAEEAGLMLPIGSWVLRQVTGQLADWRRAGAVPEELWISVNISNRQFWSGTVADEITDCLSVHRLPARCLALEITEGVIMHSVDTARAMLQELHDRGLRLDVDDFGTGYSSLGVLHQLPIDALKIDRSFITDLATDAKTRELVRTIVHMGNNLDIAVIAEGVETGEQNELLRELGCRYGQGHWFARAMPAAAAVLTG
jgi:diguanylate cyclase (GGDEF)-like protein